MRKYTSRSQKIEIYSEKYDLSKEEVKRILTEHEDLLTFEELKIRYDNPDLGKLPNWLEEEALFKMIWKTIKDYWSELFAQRLTMEELFSELYEYILKKVYMYENFNHLKVALVNRMKSLAQEYTRRGKYFIGSTDETYDSNNSNSVMYKFESPVYDDTIIDDNFFINKIRTFKDEQIKNLLILCGYLVCRN